MPIDRFWSTLTVLGFTAAVAACHTAARPAVTPAAAPVSAPAAAAAPRVPAPPRNAAPPAAPPRALSEDEIFSRESLDALNATHPLGDAFFDYDQTELREDAKMSLQRDAQWLNRWKSTKVTVQGQCDERGTAEYNLALGNLRARTVRDYLAGLGVSDARIAVVSLGKESPVCQDENEACWSQNRRGHFVITAK